jgi:dUTPase
MHINIMVKGPFADYHKQRHIEKMLMHPSDAGIDMFPMEVTKSHCIERDAGTAAAHCSTQWMFHISTGVHMVMPVGFYGRITGRSSSIQKLFGADVIESTMDAGYSGIWEVRIKCHYQDRRRVEAAINRCITGRMAIAQCIPTPVAKPIFTDWDQDYVDACGRGDKAYGSTDHIKSPVLVAQEALLALSDKLFERAQERGETPTTMAPPMLPQYREGFRDWFRRFLPR